MTTDRRALAVGLILALVGGYADAGSYLLSGSFTGHVTGNSILMAIAIVGHHGAQALSCLLAVICFLVGTAIGLVWRRRDAGGSCRPLAAPLSVEIVLIATGMYATGLGPPVGHEAFLACVCLALGVQNGILSKLGSVSVHTTFITGMFTSLVGALTVDAAGPTRRVLAAILGAFLCGASCGALAVTRAGVAGLFGVPLLLALAWLVCVTAPRRAAEG